MGQGYFLLDNPNHDARNGRFHGYDTRRAKIDSVVIHTAESDYTYGPLAVANYAAYRTSAASYHTVGGFDMRIPLLPPDYTAFHARGWNARALGYSFACRAAEWDRMPDEWVTGALEVGAAEVAGWCAEYGIDPTHVTPEIIEHGGTGIVGHGEVDPTRRTDPGRGFPWDRFITLIRAEMEDVRPLHPDPVLTQPMTFIDCTSPTGPGWWLIDDGGIANLGGAPYYGHLLDPRTVGILAAALNVPADEIRYIGDPVAIVPNDLGGYRIWTDTGHHYDFWEGTI